MLSKSCTYGLQAALYLAAHPHDGYVPIRQISDDLGLSHPFLTKVLQQLTRKGLLRSVRGMRGGVALAQAPEAVTLDAIVEAIDGRALFEGCILGLPECTADNPCALHAHWETVVNTFSATSLKDLAATTPDRQPPMGSSSNSGKTVSIPA